MSIGVWSGGAGDVASEPAAVGALERDVAARRRRDVRRVAFDLPGAARAAQRNTLAITGNEVKRLSRIVRRWAWLPHGTPPKDVRRNAHRHAGGGRPTFPQGKVTF